jgi:hypothetical protein
MAREADAAARFKEQRQTPGTETALRGSIEALSKGQPNYDRMSDQLAQTTRQQLPQLKAALEQYGVLQSLKFTGVGPAGADIYEVRFEKATTEWRISLGADGKIAGMTFRPQ